jgi:hypothetical protein
MGGITWKRFGIFEWSTAIQSFLETLPASGISGGLTAGRRCSWLPQVPAGRYDLRAPPATRGAPGESASSSIRPDVTGDRPVSGSQWRKFKGVDASALSEARLRAHYAAQWLARTSRAYGAPRPNDHHTSLGWDDAVSGLTTHALPQGTVLGLKISDLTLVLWDCSRMAVASGMDPVLGPALGLEGRRDAEIRQWLGRHLSGTGLDAQTLDAPLPYQMPEHPIGRGAPYGAAGLAEALADLVAWFGNANRVLGDTRQRIVGRGIDAPPVRCWPHHFDLDSLISFGSGAAARTVGIGFSPGDEFYDQPYFYVSCDPPPDVAVLAALPPLGHWHTHYFTAAVAVAERIVEADNQQAETEAFLGAATDILIPRA